MALRDMSVEDAPPAVVGIIAVLVLGTIIGGAFMFGVFGAFEDRYEVSGVFEQAGGLRPGADVLMAGVAIGEVRAVDPDFEAGQVVVSFKVDDEVELSENTRAEIALGTLFGGFTVRLTDPGGTATLSALPEEERRLPRSQTDVPDGVVEALDASTASLGEIDIEILNQVAGQVAEVLNGSREDLPLLFEELGRMGDILDARSVELERLVVDGQVVVEAIADQEDELFALVDSATDLLQQVTDSRDALAVLVGEGNQGVVALTELLADQRAEIERLTAGIHDTVALVAARRAEINESLVLLGPTVDEFNAGLYPGYADLYAEFPSDALVGFDFPLPFPSFPASSGRAPGGTR